ncbi:MAG: hypothetical protein Q9221_007211 [Calogaya cf. arnoldii]
MEASYYAIARQFVSLDDNCLEHPTIVAVLLGGSSIYRGRDEGGRADWDGAIIVSKKLDIVQLVNEQRQRSNLMHILGIVEEEHPDLRVPDESSPHWNHFDCVRFAGFDRLQAKRSVKILSLDYFSEAKSSIHILSYKDKRVFEAFKPPGTRFYRVQQATRLEGGLYILHDQWVYTTPPSLCGHQNREAG